MRKMIVVLGLTLALVSLFGLTAAVKAEPLPVTKKAYCHATSDPSGTHFQYLFNKAWVQHFENNGTPKAGHELDFFTVKGDNGKNGDQVECDGVKDTPQPTATLGCGEGECPTPTPKPRHHQETGPEDSASVFGWLVTMGIVLASAGIAGMRRR